MNAKSLLTVAALAAAFSAAAGAGEIGPTDIVQPFHGERSRAEVRAEAVQATRNYDFDREASRTVAPMQSTVTRQAVRADVVQALRAGRIASGEASI